MAYTLNRVNQLFCVRPNIFSALAVSAICENVLNVLPLAPGHRISHKVFRESPSRFLQREHMGFSFGFFGFAHSTVIKHSKLSSGRRC